MAQGAEQADCLMDRETDDSGVRSLDPFDEDAGKPLDCIAASLVIRFHGPGVRFHQRFRDSVEDDRGFRYGNLERVCRGADRNGSSDDMGAR